MHAIIIIIYYFLHAGVCSGENLILPSKLQNATQETALFKPIKLPTDTYNDYIWRFGSLTIVNVVGTSNAIAAAYRNRISLDMNTLSIELRNLTLSDSGDYTLSINGDKGSYTATTRLEELILLLSLFISLIYSFLYTGVCSGENLILPSKLQNATQETALFKPIKLPTDTYNDYIWRFGSLTIVNVVGTLDSAAAAYKNRISLDKTTLALELRNLTLNDSGEYVLSINGDKGSYTATTRLEVFGE
ncbi:carcinoembryonic antigen-related cell adhesion molecule 20-like isoform X2 [Astyanax mexicanus]|uniref:Carcinoembryonic antigen-related cell adhesion molecule 20-like isoform X2 n=1 Tax=Astyanax mexicanus TaxID=7994 RepID=A0A8T2LYW6_ASTMX|nr:carcinoembryonic antigen-related cell adhesion molecule 20-like isoform X2 [Astyanax mexicanus]